MGRRDLEGEGDVLPRADAHDVRRGGFVQFGEGALEVVAGGGNAHVRILSLSAAWKTDTGWIRSIAAQTRVRLANDVPRIRRAQRALHFIIWWVVKYVPIPASAICT
jgi:hypothetical protein